MVCIAYFEVQRQLIFEVDFLKLVVIKDRICGYFNVYLGP